MQSFWVSFSLSDPEARLFVSRFSEKQNLRKVMCELFLRINMADSVVDYAYFFARVGLLLRGELSPQANRICNVVCGILNNFCRLTNYTRHSQYRWQYYVTLIDGVMNRKFGKRNSLCFHGPPSAGKTLLRSVIESVVPVHLVGRFGVQGARSQFWFQSLVSKVLYCGEEISLDPMCAESVKMLMEGNPSLTTDIKHGESVAVPPRPVIITSNDPIWSMVGKECGPIRERCFEFAFVRWHGMGDTSYDRSHQAEAWRFLVSEAAKAVSLDSLRSDCDSSFHY